MTKHAGNVHVPVIFAEYTRDANPVSLLTQLTKISEHKKERIYMHWGFGFWPLLPLFWIGIVALFCWGASRWFGWRDRREPFYTPFEPDALEILRRRYARGEIDGTTFDQMRERLGHSGRPRE